MEAWQVTLLVAVIGASSGALTTIVSGIVEKIRKKREKDDNTQMILAKLNELESNISGVNDRLDGLENSQRITMHDRISWLATKYCEKGEIKYSDYQILKQMHEVYHNDLHGNGFLDDIMEDVANLKKVP